MKDLSILMTLVVLTGCTRPNASIRPPAHSPVGSYTGQISLGSISPPTTEVFTVIFTLRDDGTGETAVSSQSERESHAFTWVETTNGLIFTLPDGDSARYAYTNEMLVPLKDDGTREGPYVFRKTRTPNQGIQPTQ